LRNHFQVAPENDNATQGIWKDCGRLVGFWDKNVQVILPKGSHEALGTSHETFVLSVEDISFVASNYWTEFGLEADIARIYRGIKRS